MNIQKHPLTFLFMPFCISRIMNAKKNLEIREGSQEQWKHTSTAYNFFFLSLDFSYEYSERIPHICFYALLVFLEQ